MDNGFSGQWALSLGLWASLAACSPVGGLRHPPPTHTQEVKDPSSCQAPTVNAVKAAFEPQNQVWAAQGSPTLHTLTPGALRVPDLTNQTLRHPQPGVAGVVQEGHGSCRLY